MSQPDEATEVGKQAGIQVIARAAAIMRALGNNPQGLSLAAIAQLVELPRSTVQRIINALVDEFMVESSGPTGGFRLGPALGHLINQTQCDIISLTKSRLAELASQLQESVCLCRRVGDKVHVIDRIVAERELRVVFPIGVHASVLCVPAGKVLLAAEDAALIDAALPVPLSLEARQQLKDIHHTGVAFGADDVLEGVSSYAVALDTYLGFYSVAVVAPTSRAAPRAEVFRQALLECKYSVERAIGRTPGLCSR
jgi:DNA-binding IclR family transcriptional regulator